LPSFNYEGNIVYHPGIFNRLIFENITKKWALWNKKIGWQFHHSLIGLILVLLRLAFSPYRLELISAGVGVIIQYTALDGLIFIRKWK
jgi:hypothetical protein